MGIRSPAVTPPQFCSGFACQLTRLPINALRFFLLIHTISSPSLMQCVLFPKKGLSRRPKRLPAACCMRPPTAAAPATWGSPRLPRDKHNTLRLITAQENHQSPLRDHQNGYFSYKTVSSCSTSQLFSAHHLFFAAAGPGEPAPSTSPVAPSPPRAPAWNILGNIWLLPLGEMCLQVIVGSGLPVAMQVRLTLPPSLMEMSEEISVIFGDTAEAQRGK